MLTVVESPDLLEIQSTFPVGKRVLFLLLSLFPLIAPYQLILKVNWLNYFNVFFIFAFVISLGAIAVSAFFVWAAIAGMESRLRFDLRQGKFLFTTGAPITIWQTNQGQIKDISKIQVEKHDWSDGAPSYSILTITNDGQQFKIGSSWSLGEINDIANRVSAFLGLPPLS
jgi:hypothetical protein